MAVFFITRFDLRNPAAAGTSMAERYTAALEMAEWADRLGGVAIVLSEHHGSDDGYLPSPVTMAAAVAARTTNVRIGIAALIAPFYDPLRLAEDILVLDNLSGGRIDLVIGNGYVPDEFDMLGVPTRERVARVKEVVTTLRAAFTGEPFSYRGRTVHLTPAPHGDGPSISLGGNGEPAARRAARLGVPFLPAVPEAWPFYCDEVEQLGRPHPGPCPIQENNRIVALAEDPEKAWDEMGPFFLHEMQAYGAWQAQAGIASPYHSVADIDELRETNSYAILTPDEYVAELAASPFPFVVLHPLVGGMPPDLAWSSLRLFEHEVVPALAD